MPFPSPFFVVFVGALDFCFAFCDFFAAGWFTSNVCPIRQGAASKQNRAVVAMKCFVPRMGAMNRRRLQHYSRILMPRCHRF